jgi:hypothetical protein
MKGLTEFQRSQYYAKYKKGTAKGLKEADTILKVLPLLDVLMDAIEDLENSPMFRQKMKMYGNKFKGELVHALNLVNNTDDETQKQSFSIMDQVETIDSLVGNIHVSKFPLLINVLERFGEITEFPLLINVLERFGEITEGTTDKFIESIVTRQYAKITEFVLPAALINKLKKIMPLIEDVAVVQIAQQISREQLQNTKGFGDESIKILEEVFSTSGIKW